MGEIAASHGSKLRDRKGKGNRLRSTFRGRDGCSKGVVWKQEQGDPDHEAAVAKVDVLAVSMQCHVYRACAAD